MSANNEAIQRLTERLTSLIRSALLDAYEAGKSAAADELLTKVKAIVDQGLDKPEETVRIVRRVHSVEVARKNHFKGAGEGVTIPGIIAALQAHPAGLGPKATYEAMFRAGVRSVKQSTVRAAMNKLRAEGKLAKQGDVYVLKSNELATRQEPHRGLGVVVSQ
ncbi:MAG TPA: hypothetical protein VHY79_10095 [Rhizomicrobium sp.]|jgi:hypothetical protein|nr:hypothetical protein [Rhizomicrobium sp.]